MFERIVVPKVNLSLSAGKVKELVSREKEDLDEIILTKTRLEKGIQVSRANTKRRREFTKIKMLLLS